MSVGRVVGARSEARRSQRGPGDVRPFGAATEASYFAQIAPTVVFGPGVLSDAEGAVAHGPREYMDVAEVREATNAVERTLRTLVR